MPKRTDIKSILLIGSGPIVIGQACEFDYSGTQAMKALREEGMRVILVNSNPATIMTDPDLADATYIEPITPEYVAAIIEKERPDAVLPTMGGQTALNTALALDEQGILEKYNCELIGAKVDSIMMAEDRELFRQAMDDIGLQSAKSGVARSLSDAEDIAERIGYPLILRPSRTLGGSGGGVVENPGELHQKVAHALQMSPNSEVLIEQSLLGWKEFELEVMRDLHDNVVIICSIENIDPMGVHTGDSITVAPIQTLTDKEYQELRDASIRIIRKIGVDTGGSNVQFAINPQNGEIIVIEMNPRVSRSSALASKATGFPIAKIAAKLAIGYTLDEISNDITRETPACFEPAIDYTVVKIPRFNFEKFPLADPRLGTQMKSVGEIMSIGRCFRQAMQKGLSSMELDSYGFDREQLVKDKGEAELLEACRIPTSHRLWCVGEALRRGHSVDELYELTGIDPWFLAEIEAIIDREKKIDGTPSEKMLTPEHLEILKHEGFTDRRIANLLEVPEDDVRQARKDAEIRPSYRLVDTCAAEFVAHTPYLYSSYDHGEDEAAPTDKEKVVILGSGPNRIGQGIEFDYCCVHALLALREIDYESIMINCNPETVSTDYDMSDRLYFEPLTLESVLGIIEREKPLGVIVQFGGQTPLKLASDLQRCGVNILGTSVDSIDLAEDRERFSAFIKELGMQQPEFATARSLDEALESASKMGYPLMIRPSFVLGGRAMRVVYSEQDLRTYMAESVDVSNDRPVLLDRFLDNAIEVDLDAVSDGEEVIISGIMEHIERAGIHSGDSSCCLPPQTLGQKVIDQMRESATKIALALHVKGLMNIQFAITPDEQVYIIEVNPRASRTVPFVSKATGNQWAKIAAKLMVGKKLSELQEEIREVSLSDYCAVKASVFPFMKFQGVDTILGPEMKSTGEVMGIAPSFASSFAKAQASSQVQLPLAGNVFVSVTDRDKQEILPVAQKLTEQGFRIIATSGTASFLQEQGIECEVTNKVREGSPHIVDLLGQGEIQLVLNTPEGHDPILDSRSIRLVANELSIPTYTTIAAGAAATEAICLLKKEAEQVEVCSIQEYHLSSNRA